jgi:hypothetical protein
MVTSSWLAIVAKHPADEGLGLNLLVTHAHTRTHTHTHRHAYTPRSCPYLELGSRVPPDSGRDAKLDVVCEGRNGT